MKPSLLLALAALSALSQAIRAGAPAPDVPPVSAQVAANRAVIEELHRTRPYSRALLALPALADEVEWWAAGDRGRLPWAGSWTGRAGITEFFRLLAAEMAYERFETTEIMAAGHEVVTIIRAGGRAKRTGREFQGEIVRVYTFREGQLLRVRSYYDTSEYERAMARGQPPGQ